VNEGEEKRARRRRSSSAQTLFFFFSLSLSTFDNKPLSPFVSHILTSSTTTQSLVASSSHNSHEQQQPQERRRRRNKQARERRRKQTKGKKNAMADNNDNNQSDLSRVYRAVAAGESAEQVLRVIEEVAQGSDETRALAVNKKGEESDETPLAAAHRLRRGDLVGALVEAGADVGGVFGGGPWTPVAVCIVYGQAESVSALLKAGHDPNERISWDMHVD
jgi:alanyl-tRNA synthetase